MQFLLYTALIIAICLVLFAVQNPALVTVNFLFFSFEGSLAFILILVFGAGFLAALMLAFSSLIRKSSALREQKKIVKKLENTVTTQRHSPYPEDETHFE